MSPDFIERFYVFIFRKKGREGERETSMCKRNSDWLPPTRPLLGNLAHNPGMCPDQESNLQRFGSQTNAQSIEQHQPRFSLDFKCHSLFYVI